MQIQEETWHDIPLLHIVENQYKDQDIPVAIFLHGFTSAKEHNLHYAYNLAKKGIRVLLPEAHLHGVRSEKIDEVELALRFWEVVMTSIEELPILHQTLKEKGLVKTAKISVGGTSMGGITTLGALSIYDWIDASIVMMGAPGFQGFLQEQMRQFEQRGFDLPVTEVEKNQLFEQIAMVDLTKRPEALNGRPIYFWHGQKDPVVPYAPTYQFYESIKPMYVDQPGKLVFESDKVASHAVTRKGLLNAVNWLASQLNE